LTGGVSYSEPARATSRPSPFRWFRLAGLLAVLVAIVAAVGSRSPEASSSGAAGSPIDAPRGENRGAADGAVPVGATVFDDEVPGVANLDPDVRGALRRAATEAAHDGVELFVDSGWRSPEYQARLFQEAVLKYGSRAQAARWVATARTSAHVSGDAVDIGPPGAAAWLSEHSAHYGLCRIYGNEPWHFELRTEARDHGCPAMYVDPTHDPRMQ
jgi:hypothetical protein